MSLHRDADARGIWAGVRIDEFSTVIGQLYDAALDPTKWEGALEGVCSLLKARTAALASYDLFDRKPPWQFQVGYDPYWMKVYTEKYLALNPYVDEVARLGPGESAYSSARPDYDALLRSEFYLGWLKPQGLVDGSVLVIDKTSTTIATLVNVRDETQGLFDEGTTRLLDAIYPHIRRATLIGQIIGDHRTREGVLAAALDSLSAGVFLLTKQGGLVHANAAGQSMLDTGAPARLTRGHFQLSVEGPARALDAALAAAAQGEVALGGMGVTIPVGDRANHTAHLLPLSVSRGGLISGGTHAAFVVFLRRSDPNDGATVNVLSRRFGLTPKETTVLRTVVEVGGVPLAADVLGLSATTVRSHVTAIFDKTGVRRQADLIRLLTETKSPFLA